VIDVDEQSLILCVHGSVRCEAGGLQ
jgi:hypothetical protein